jgi:DNA-binding transcriptional ArsR family regulator
MPLAEQPLPTGDGGVPQVLVAPSAAVELYWVTVLEPDRSIRVDHPSLAGLAGRPELLARLASLWDEYEDARSPVAHHHVPELLALADRAGALRSIDLDDMLAAVVDAAAIDTAPPALASETTEERALIVRRLEILAHHPRQRGVWGQTLADVVSVIGDHWRTVGLGVSARAARARTSQLPWLEPIGAVVGWAKRDYKGLLPELMSETAGDRRPILVVPSYWSGRGIMFDLYDELLVGIPAQLGATDSRARTEPMSRILKAMADPTRLAMLDHLASRPRTVGELATDFGLAQPTTSRHVRILRDAGLVAEERRGSANRLAVDHTAVSRLIGSVGALLGAEVAGHDGASDQVAPARRGSGATGRGDRC